MLQQNYIPLIKTTDAELRGFSELSSHSKNSCLPLFELTKSRKTKLEPYGNIDKRMKKIQNIIGEREFILDLTSHEDMINFQIEDLLDEENGFENWRQFLELNNQLNIIPVIHVNPDELQETTSLTSWLDKNYQKFVLRIDPLEDTEIVTYLDAIALGCDDLSKLIVIFDAGYIDQNNFESTLNETVVRINEIESYGVGSIVVASSSFPKSVFRHTQDCLDSRGFFPKLEKEFHGNIQSMVSVEVIYGDYASIHPVRYNTGGGGGWIPRVDFPTEDSFIYTRFRRDEGGYIQAAVRMVEHSEFENIKSWGCREIISASKGAPNGLSPSFWIAVRLNLHITREVIRLGFS